MKHAANNDELLEFGTRRAHEFDAALWGTRAAFIGGFSSTSNVRAGKRFGIPVAGTHAHSLFKLIAMNMLLLRNTLKLIKNVSFSLIHMTH